MSQRTSRQVFGAAVATVGVVAFMGGIQSVGAAAGGQDHAGQYAQADIEYGLRVYRTTCATCHAESGAGVPGVNLAVSTPRARSDRELSEIIETGIPGTAMPPGEYSPGELTALIAYVRTMGELDANDVRLGDAGRGESIVLGTGDCTSCHRLGTDGPLGLAPALTSIGATRTAGALEASLLDPTAAMRPINRPVRVVLADGTRLDGRRLNEDTYTVQLIDTEGGLRSLEKATLREFVVIKESPMSSYAETLTEDEISDVVAYLLTLRGVEGLN